MLQSLVQMQTLRLLVYRQESTFLQQAFNPEFIAYPSEYLFKTRVKFWPVIASLSAVDSAGNVGGDPIKKPRCFQRGKSVRPYSGGLNQAADLEVVV